MALLKDEVIVITGASSGIGECLAHCCAREGAQKLILVAEDQGALDQARGAQGLPCAAPPSVQGGGASPLCPCTAALLLFRRRPGFRYAVDAKCRGWQAHPC